MGGERRPSVLMTADTVGGVWTYAVELSRALAQRGVRVHLATMGAPVQAHQRAQVADIASVTLHESAFALEWMAEPWDDVRQAGEWLLALARRLRPDLVHLNQFAFGALPFGAPTLLVAHSCVLSWWQAVHREAAPAQWNRYRTAVVKGLLGADLVAAPTRTMLQSLAGNYGFRRHGVVLPNGRDPQLFAPGGKQPYVFAAGRFWDEAKNLRALQDAAPQLPWPVRVAGSCLRPDGARIAPQHVTYLGALPAPDLARQLAHATIYALPARYEPFGLSALEAALAGCALVLGDIASLHEVWGDSAVYVKPEDSAALAGALRGLIEDPQRCARLAAAARRRALHFHPRRMADMYLRAYGSLCPEFHAREELQCA